MYSAPAKFIKKEIIIIIYKNLLDFLCLKIKIKKTIERIPPKIQLLSGKKAMLRNLGRSSEMEKNNKKAINKVIISLENKTDFVYFLKFRSRNKK
jgi:hypothetical protein